MKKTSSQLLALTMTAAFALLCHISCGGAKKPPSDPAPPVAVTSLTLNRNSMTLAVGGVTGTLVPTIAPNEATNKNIAWSSSNTAVATVDSNGVVTPRSIGSATIAVTHQDGDGRSMTAECHIEVVSTPIAATGAYLNKNKLSIAEGGCGSLAVNFIPATATDQHVTWRSSNPAVAIVDANGAVTAKAKGSAEIIATYQQKAGSASVIAALNATLKVEAKSEAVPVTGVETHQESLWLSIGGSDLLLPTVLPNNATNVNVSFSSSDPTTASVSSFGLVTGRKEGAVIVTMTTEDGGHEAKCVVFVDDAVNPTGVSLNKTYITLRGDIGETEQLSATIAPIVSITEREATDKSLYWYSSDQSVAAVSMSGEVQARGSGTAKITAETQVGGHKDTCDVTVVGVSPNVPVVGVLLNKASTSIAVDGAEILAFTLLPANATNKNVTWVSSSPAIASVSPSGIVTGIAAGRAAIAVVTQDGSKTATCLVTVTHFNR